MMIQLNHRTVRRAKVVLRQAERKKLAMEAFKKAAHIRSHSLRVAINAPICIYDAAEKLGVRVVFKEDKTVEGIYRKGNPPNIIVSSLRPTGRQAFTCAHELGHHVFGHGDVWGEVLTWGSNDPDEFLVDCFAGYLMMPPSVVNQALTVRGWNVSRLSPVEAFVLAGIMGVGYTTLLNHMNLALNNSLSYQRAELLQKTEPKQIRKEIIGEDVSEDVVVVDEHWPSEYRSIDVKVGDYIVLPHGTVTEGGVADHVDSIARGEIYRGVRPGTGRFMNSRFNWAAFIRVTRRNYTGFARYRHLEDEEFLDEE